jgi:hypothetical protein
LETLGRTRRWREEYKKDDLEANSKSPAAWLRAAIKIRETKSKSVGDYDIEDIKSELNGDE